MVNFNANLVQKTLKAVNVAKQDRIAVSGNLAGALPAAILSQERRHTPSSRELPEPRLWSALYAPAYMAGTTIRAGRLAASRFGFLACRAASCSTTPLAIHVPPTPATVAGSGRTTDIGRVGTEVWTWHQVHADHDYQSNDQRDAQIQTHTGQQPVRGATQTQIHGK
jgi:hypothetical protein